MTIDKPSLKQGVLGLCLETSFDLWEVLDVVVKEVMAGGGEGTRRGLIDVAREVVDELLAQGHLDAFARLGNQPEESLAAADARAAIVGIDAWTAPKPGARVLSVTASPTGRALHASKRLLKG